MRIENIVDKLCTDLFCRFSFGYYDLNSIIIRLKNKNTDLDVIYNNI